MNEIIKVNYEGEEPRVSARDLHTELKIAKRFSTWFSVNSNGFVEGEDFTGAYLKVHSNQYGGEKEIQDYNLSLDMAKHICLMSRTEKGKQCRQYLIDLEKAWNTPEQVMARALKIAEKTMQELKLQIEEQKPLVEFAKHVTESSDTVDIGEFAKIVMKEKINIGRNRLFSWLRENKYLMRNNIPYQKYLDNGYFEVIETIKETAYGSRVFTKTLVTGKGQIFLVEKLRNEFSDK